MKNSITHYEKKSKEEKEKIFGDKKILYTDKDRQNLITLYLEDFPEKSRKKFWYIASGAKREMLNFALQRKKILKTLAGLKNFL